MNAPGQCFAHAAERVATIEALMLNKSSLVIPVGKKYQVVFLYQTIPVSLGR